MDFEKICAGIIGFIFFVGAILSIFMPDSTNLKTQSCKNETSNYNVSLFEKKYLGYSYENNPEIQYNRFNFHNETEMNMDIETMRPGYSDDYIELWYSKIYDLYTLNFLERSIMKLSADYNSCDAEPDSIYRINQFCLLNNFLKCLVKDTKSHENIENLRKINNHFIMASYSDKYYKLIVELFFNSKTKFIDYNLRVLKINEKVNEDVLLNQELTVKNSEQSNYRQKCKELRIEHYDMISKINYDPIFEGIIAKIKIEDYICDFGLPSMHDLSKKKKCKK